MAPRLGVIDQLHLRLDVEMRAAGHGGAGCALALELDGRCDLAWLRDRLRVACVQVEELGWRLERRLLRAEQWRGTRAAPAVRDVPLEGRVEDMIAARMTTCVGGDEPWRIELLRGDRDVVALYWFHPLIDALGAYRLMGWLGADALLPLEGERWIAPEARLADIDWRGRLALAQAFGKNSARHGRMSITSLAHGSSGPGRLRALRLRLDEAQTSAFDRKAGRADTSILAWAASRYIDRILASRGRSRRRYVMAMPLSLDKKRGETRMFGNNTTMVMLSLGSECLGDDAAAAVAELATQRREIVRQQADIGMLAALDLLRPVPSGLAAWYMRRPFGGHRASFILSSPGAIDISTFAGERVSDAMVMSAVAPDPGLMVVGQRHRDRQSVVMTYCDGYLKPEELEAERAAFVSDLCGADR